MSHDADDAPTTEQPPPAPRPRFTRSRQERVIGGVGGGLGAALGLDPWVVRIAFVVTGLFGGVGVVAYLAALAFLPDEDGGDAPLNSRRVLHVAGFALLAIATLAILDGGLGWDFLFLGPQMVVLGVLGVVAYYAYRALDGRGGPQPPAARIAAAVLLTLALICLAGVAFVGSLWLAASGGDEIVAGTVIGLGVVAVGAAFVRPVRWLAPAALVLALPAAFVAAADLDTDGGIGNRSYRPLTPQELRSEPYRVGIGEVRVDLRQMRWPRSGLVRIKLDVGIGHGVVYVPEGVCVRARGEAGVGYIEVLDEDSGGVDVDFEAGKGTLGDAPRLEVEAQVGVGAIEVLHEGGRRREGPFESHGPFGDNDELRLDDEPAPVQFDGRSTAACERIRA